MMEAVRTSETSIDNHFTRQYNPEDSSEQVVKTQNQSVMRPRRMSNKAAAFKTTADDKENIYH
jgi:hypothetical protein